MKIIRYFLFPISLVYGGIVWLRNFLYDARVFKGTGYNFPIICIGNLSVGGTGKTPMTAYLLNFLKYNGTVGMLSRGYKRSSTGFVVANEGVTMEELGDEPYQMYCNFPESIIAVDSDRRNGISQLKQRNMLPDVLLLDDGYQHRKVTAGFYILLTTYNQLYVDDCMLPTGNLRDTVNQASRAHCIVVTKCPPDLSNHQKERVLSKLKPKPGQPVYFATISYANTLYGKNKDMDMNELSAQGTFTLVTGIAKPEYLVSYLKDRKLTFEHLNYPDHHNFSEKEIALLLNKDCVVTTEKDYVRLSDKLNKVYYLPIALKFLEGEEQFVKQLKRFVQSYKAGSAIS